MPLVVIRSPSTNRYTPLQKVAQYMYEHLFLEPGRSECICHVPLVEPYIKQGCMELRKFLMSARGTYGTGQFGR